MAGKPGRSGGKRPGAGRPMGAKNFRYKTSAELIEAARIDENLIPVKFEGDSLAFLKATMEGKIWPTREQIYAAKSVLPIEYSPAVTVDTIVQQSIFLSQEYFEFEQRALKVLRKHPEALADWVAEFGEPVLMPECLSGPKMVEVAQKPSDNGDGAIAASAPCQQKLW